MTNMSRLIKSVYNGFDVPPCDYIGRYSPDYNKYRENAFHAEQELRMKIPAELIAEFDNCMELHLLMVMAAGQDGFIHGFRMGGKLMVQTLT